VDDSEDIDSINEILSKIRFGDERHTLLQETSLIIWDEFMSNHKHCLNAALKITDNFHGKVVVCMGDTRQIPPVVVRGSAAEVSLQLCVLCLCVCILSFAIIFNDLNCCLPLGLRCV
jgi:PIF1-like helicase